MNKNYLKKISFVVALFILGLTFSLGNKAEAATKAVTGYAWSSNIGWISFQGSNYGVNFDDQNGNLSGYAWSSNIGWIKFTPSPFYPCPSGHGPCQANVNTANGVVTGWARACSATATKNCDGSLASDGYWDGWIYLGTISGVSGTGVTYNSTDGKLNGYAWGNNILGWIKFNPGGSGVVIPPNNATPTCSQFTVSQVTNSGSGNVSINWNIQNDNLANYTLRRDGVTVVSGVNLPTGSVFDTINDFTPHQYTLTGGAANPACPTRTITITNTNTETGKLWLGNNQNTVQVTMDTDDYVDVRWSIPAGAVCQTTQPAGAPSIPNWIPKTINSTPGVQRVRNLAEGDYILGLSCVDENSAPLPAINTVKLIVSDGELEEI